MNDTDEQLEKRVAELKEKLGLQTNETPSNPLFQGDWGYSIDLSIIIPSLLLLLIGAVLLFSYITKKKKSL